MYSWTKQRGVRRTGWRALPLIILSSIVVACGGGGYGGGSQSAPAAAASGPAGVSVGAITGFGSVHLNGKKFETTSASISIDGQPATQADLQVGDVVEVKGHHDSSTGKDIADEIDMHSNVVGPLTTIDATAQTLVVLGQMVAVSANTSFGKGIAPASVAGLVAGDVLRISGMVATDGSIQATRIERMPAGTPFRAIGVASATDSTAKTLKINALVVDFSAANLSDFPASGPKDGDLIEADGTTVDSAGTLKATRLELRTGKGLHADVNGEGEIEGLLTRFASATDFDVAGKSVTTSSSTTFEGGSATDLALNVRVEVEGTVDAAGLLTAAKVRIERPADVRIVAQVDAVDATAGNVTMLGVKVSVTALTRFEDHSAAKVNTFSLADVHTGDWLEVRGGESPAGSNAVVAARLERRDNGPAVLLAGVVKTATAPAFTILSVNVATTPTTQLFDAKGNTATATDFFTGLVGKTALGLGTWDGTTLTATKAMLGGGDHGETEDD
jgi:hypothetical protein